MCGNSSCKRSRTSQNVGSALLRVLESLHDQDPRALTHDKAVAASVPRAGGLRGVLVALR